MMPKSILVMMFIFLVSSLGFTQSNSVKLTCEPLLVISPRVFTASGKLYLNISKVNSESGPKLEATGDVDLTVTKMGSSVSIFSDTFRVATYQSSKYQIYLMNDPN